MKLIKQCGKRTKRGRCQKAGHLCSFHPQGLLSMCPMSGEKASPEKKGGKKKK